MMSLEGRVLKYGLESRGRRTCQRTAEGSRRMVSVTMAGTAAGRHRRWARAAFVLVAFAAASCSSTHATSSVRETDEVDQLRPVLMSSTGSCGVERWPVKVATDRDASAINQTPQSTTVEELA